MNVLVLGANGQVGSRVCRELLVRGHSVIAVVHSRKENIPEEARATALNVTDRQAVEAALDGVDAVVCALSSWKAPSHDVLATAMKTLVPAMERRGVSRIVSVSGNIACLPDERPALSKRLMRVVAVGAPGKVVRDSEEHIRLLNESTLAWTVLRPSIMSSRNVNDYNLRQKMPLAPFVPRAAVVAAIADLIESGACARQAPYITGA